MIMSTKRLMPPMLVLLILCPASKAGADEPEYLDGAKVKPHRKGFTLELGLGLGLTHAFPNDVIGASSTKLGIAPLSLSLGGFINPRWALFFRMAGTGYFQRATLRFQDGTEKDNELLLGVLGFYGVTVQHWFNDWLFVAGGPGLALHGLLEDLTSAISIHRGFGLSVRVGVSVVTWTHHSLAVTLELFPSFFDGQRVLAEALKLEWQWF